MKRLSHIKIKKLILIMALCIMLSLIVLGLGTYNVSLKTIDAEYMCLAESLGNEIER